MPCKTTLNSTRGFFSAKSAASGDCATLGRPHAPAVKSGYAPVNGLGMYYEIHGSSNSKSPPLVLLHGGGSTIETPTLVIIGDHDIVRPEHAVLMFRLLPTAQLAVLPGMDHMTIVKRSDWLLSMVEVFLDSPMPKETSS